MYRSTASWTRVALAVVEQIKQTTDARELSRANWPRWALGSTQVNRMLAFSQLASLGTTLPSTGVVAALLTERIDPNDAPKLMNYNFYLIAESASGQYHQSPPMRPIDPAQNRT
mgnify:CR=1 FL=1